MQVQPVRVGDEHQHAPAAHQPCRCAHQSRDIQELIHKALQTLLHKEGEYNPDRVLTPEELAACAPRLADALHAAAAPAAGARGPAAAPNTVDGTKNLPKTTTVPARACRGRGGSQEPAEVVTRSASPLSEMTWPQFLALCGLLPFLLVSILHLLYASRCWHAYVQSGAWAGMLALNVLVLAPYANVLAFPALLVWLLIANSRGVRR